ncbi:MAG TPA: ATP-binding protein [Phycisphaerae bacterium]|jgi:two-component system phosphate regulon sensor histidine kinase PhoR|nr:PAS domain S-box protein [Phycisphaerae bacterium]HOB76316.1 ATP-binding protein [Phycisphaerae bacterium]HOJ55481.1 ATP-binding protein [Phycisphaerae bacterium]HOL25990.1 ATP-binding protein [Phycisphaerae bacterium]HPP22716.1 ATP-binding protein [Phycisphaerae bacterium]
MRWLRRPWSLKNFDEIPPWVGLSLGLLYLVAVVAVGGAALYVQKQELAETQLAGAARWSECLARHLACVQKTDPQSLANELRRAGREDGVAWCAIASSEGRYQLHSDPGRVGKQVEHLEVQPSTIGNVQIATDPAQPHGRILIVRLPPAASGQKPEELHVALAPPPFAWNRSGILIWAGYILPVVLALYLACYRLFRRSVRPLAAIRKRLAHCSQPTIEQLAALRLNDSFDQISSSWNQLIDFVTEMQEQLRRTRLNTDMTAAMDAFRSERLTNILMQLPFGVMVVEADGSISFANRAAAGMVGSAGESLEGRSTESLFDEALRASLLAGPGPNRGAATGAGRWIDYTFKRPHGDITLRFWSLVSEFGDQEHILFMQDISQAREAERARDSFLYHITHELRTPLTNIRAYAETLSQGVIDDPQTIRECYNIIMGETQRLNRLIEDILNVSQLEVGSARLNLSEVALDGLLRKVVQDMQGNADAKHLDLVLSLPAKTPRVRGDRDRLTVVLVNLIGNAIKYTPEGGRVEIDCTPENERLRINITDTGIGIAPEHQEKIFEKFYRVSDERVQGVPGTGLGLAIVRETVRLHGGNVFVNSTPGKGSTFSLVLPAQPLDGGPADGVARQDASTEKK